MWLHCLLLGKGQCGASPPRQGLWRSQLQGIGQGILKDSHQWTSCGQAGMEAMEIWAKPTGLCRRSCSLSYKKASWRGFSLCEMLTNFGSTSQESNKGRLVLRLRSFSNSLISECSQSKASTVKHCFSAVLSQRELAKSSWFAVGLQCSVWESAGAVLEQVWGHKGSGVPDSRSYRS